MHLGLRSVPLGHLRTIARVSSFRCSAVLHPDGVRSFCPALPAAGHGTTVSSVRLPGSPGVISLPRFVHRSAIAALQTAIHLAGIGDHFVGSAGLLGLAKIAKREASKASE